MVVVTSIDQFSIDVTVSNFVKDENNRMEHEITINFTWMAHGIVRKGVVNYLLHVTAILEMEID